MALKAEVSAPLVVAKFGARIQRFTDLAGATFLTQPGADFNGTKDIGAVIEAEIRLSISPGAPAVC